MTGVAGLYRRHVRPSPRAHAPAPVAPPPAVPGRLPAPSRPAWLARLTPPGPAAPIAALYTALEALMRLGTAMSFRQRFHQIAPVIDRTFDLPTILRSSVGTRWTTLDDGRAERVARRVPPLHHRHLCGQFRQIRWRTVRADPDVAPCGRRPMVQTRIIQDNGEPIRLDYVMRQTDAGWRAIDILLDGTISRVAVQHSDFRALLHDRRCHRADRQPAAKDGRIGGRQPARFVTVGGPAVILAGFAAVLAGIGVVQAAGRRRAGRPVRRRIPRPRSGRG